MRITPVAAAMVALLAAALPSHADDGEVRVAFSGFGTISGVVTNNDKVEYTPNPGFQPNGVKKGWETDIDTLLGAQVNANLGERYSAVLQLLSKRRAENNYKPEVEWAFLSMQATPDAQLRFGRLGTPFYMVSDFRNVNYANPWVRPPTDIYGQVNFSYHDGIDLLYLRSLGEHNLSLQLYFGRSENRFWAPPNSTFDLQLTQNLGANLAFESGPYALRYGYHRGVLKGNSDRIDAVYKALTGTPDPRIPAAVWALACPGCAGAGRDLSIDNKAATFQGVGLTADWGKYLLLGEYTMRRTDTGAIADTSAWYVTAAMRLGKFTPYLGYSQLRQDSPTADSRFVAVPTGIASVDAMAPGIVAQFANGVNSVLSDRGQKTVSLGVRYDVWRNIALKAQFDRIDMTGPAHNGLSAVSAPGADFDGKLDTWNLSVDFVF